jgi:hypothetical protein
MREFSIFSASLFVAMVLCIGATTGLFAIYQPVTKGAIAAIVLTLLLFGSMMAFDNRKLPLIAFLIAGVTGLYFLVPLWIAIPLPLFLFIYFTLWEILFRPYDPDIRKFLQQFLEVYQQKKNSGAGVNDALDAVVLYIEKLNKPLAEEIRGEALGSEKDSEDSRIKGLLWHLYSREFSPPKEAAEGKQINQIINQICLDYGVSQQK